MLLEFLKMCGISTNILSFTLPTMYLFTYLLVIVHHWFYFKRNDAPIWLEVPKYLFSTKSKISTCTFSCLSTNFKKVHQCFCKSSILPSIIELFFFYDAPLRWSFNYAKISKLTSVPSSGGSHCKSGAMHCLMNSFKSYSRSMDELAYQLNLSDTLDWSYDDDEDETNSTLGKKDCILRKWKRILLQRKVHKTIFFPTIFSGNLDDETLRQVHLDLCYSCSKAIPIEVEDGLQRLASLLLNSTQTLKHIRGVCSRLKQKIRHCQGRLSEKALLISQWDVHK